MAKTTKTITTMHHLWCHRYNNWVSMVAIWRVTLRCWLCLMSFKQKWFGVCCVWSLFSQWLFVIGGMVKLNLTVKDEWISGKETFDSCDAFDSCGSCVIYLPARSYTHKNPLDCEAVAYHSFIIMWATGKLDCEKLRCVSRSLLLRLKSMPRQFSL